MAEVFWSKAEGNFVSVLDMTVIRKCLIIASWIGLSSCATISEWSKTRWLPNSVTAGFGDSYLTNEYVGHKVDEVSVRNNSMLPPVISGFGLMTTESPPRKTFDFDFRFAPRLNIYAIDATYNYAFRPDNDDGPKGGQIDYHLKVYWLSPTYNAETTFHWPLGATYFGFGLGAGAYQYKDDYSGETGFVTTTAISMGHRTFFTDNLFMNFGYEFLFGHKNVVYNEIFKGGDAYSFALVIGYRLTENESKSQKHEPKAKS